MIKYRIHCIFKLHVSLSRITSTNNHFFYPDIAVMNLATIKPRFEVEIAVQLRIQIFGCDVVMLS
jgi:hypothetical protein